MSKVIFGIDYSLTTPAMCMLNPEEPHFNAGAHFFQTGVKKYAKQWMDNIYGTLHDEYQTPTERYYNISTRFVHTIKLAVSGGYDPHVYLEGYSMGSKGKVFHIAENVGFLKAILWMNEVPVVEVPPTVLKKYACSKGNADKNMMYAAFVGNPSNPPIDYIINPDRDVGPVKSPITDIVDAYFLAKYGVEHQNGLHAAKSRTNTSTTEL